MEQEREEEQKKNEEEKKKLITDNRIDPSGRLKAPAWAKLLEALLNDNERLLRIKFAADSEAGEALFLLWAQKMVQNGLITGFLSKSARSKAKIIKPRELLTVWQRRGEDLLAGGQRTMEDILGIKVDLVTYRSLDKKLKPFILRDAKRIL